MAPHYKHPALDWIRRALFLAIWIAATVMLWRIAWYWGVLGGLVISGLTGRVQEYTFINRLRAERPRQGIPLDAPTSDAEARTGIDVRATLPAIGREISWVDILRHVFTVHGLDRAGTTVGPNDEVRPGGPGPYGFLHVESPILSQWAALPIIHRDDFLLATIALDEFEMPVNTELLVTYAPARVLPGGLSGSPSRVLHYAVVPKGTLERYYSMNGDRHMASPDPERIFGKFVYEGRISVRIVADPAL